MLSTRRLGWQLRKSFPPPKHLEYGTDRDSYLLPLSSLQLLYGTLSTSFGTKPLFLFAYFTFGLGCLLCGVSQTMNQLIVARAITGIAGGFNALSSIVLSEFIPLRKRGLWQAWRSLIFAVGLGAGSCGGWITETIGWRWCGHPSAVTTHTAI